MRSEASFMWQVDDGYVGRAAPQYTHVTEQDIQDCETVEEAVQFVEDEIEADFRNHANPSWDGDKLREQVREIWEKEKE